VLRLFTRTTRSVAPTEAGERVLRTCLAAMKRQNIDSGSIADGGIGGHRVNALYSFLKRSTLSMKEKFVHLMRPWH
jgi:hypothetical protein